MQILSADIGTGTQDIFLFQKGLGLDNGYKLVMPSPTMVTRRRLQEATRRGDPVLLTGVTMGGGPCHWAAEDHLRAGYRVYATPDAARTFNDDLDWVVREMGIVVIDEEEALHPKEAVRLELRDFDYPGIRSAFEAFGVSLEPAAVAVAVFDHGAAPPGVSDRLFRFEYLERQILAQNHLTAFAFRAEDVPPFLTRMKAVSGSARSLACPLVVMDTAPAAIQGALLDPFVSSRPQQIVANVGNFHTLAFRLNADRIEGLFEHHTGLLDLPRLEHLLVSLADGTLNHREVYEDNGHGAWLSAKGALHLESGHFALAVTGPRRSMLSASSLHPYFAVPYGDMMLTGCYGLLVAVADLLPDLAPVLRPAMEGRSAPVAPWELES